MIAFVVVVGGGGFERNVNACVHAALRWELAQLDRFSG